MDLDLLQNAPINQSLNTRLLQRKHQNIPPILQSSFKKNQQDLEHLSAFFGGDSGGNFSFSSGDFTQLFLLFSHLHIGFALSNHQQAFQAYKLCKNFCKITPILPSKQEGIILDLPQCDLYILPLVNQDLLTLNPILDLKQKILSQNPKAIFVIDISYAIAWGEKLDISLDDQTIFLCDGESLGFLRGYGIFLGLSNLCSLFPPIRYIDGFYQSFLEEIQRRQNQHKDDKKELFYQQIKDELNEQVSLFAPLSHCLINTLPLRFSQIKARSLLQSLYLEEIFAINGQECLFGFSSPSFVLQAMGYTELQSRELLSLSFQDFDLSTIKKIAYHYKNIKTLEV